MRQTDIIKSYSPYILYNPEENISIFEQDTAFVCLFNSTAEVFDQFAKQTSDSAAWRESIFINHELPKKSEKEIERKPQASLDWVFAALLGIPLLISWRFKINSLNLRELLASLFALRSLNSIFNRNFGKNNMKISMFFLYSISFGLLLYWIASYFEKNYDFLSSNSFFNFVILFTGFSVSLLLKYGMIKIFGSIFQSQEITKIYLFNIVNYNFIISAVLCFFLFFLYFGTFTEPYYLLYPLGGILALLFFFRMIMGIKILLFESKFSKPYLFYYLCIVEIAPILVIVKYLI